jgi:hypothetical protein
LDVPYPHTIRIDHFQTTGGHRSCYFGKTGWGGRGCCAYFPIPVGERGQLDILLQTEFTLAKTTGFEGCYRRFHFLLTRSFHRFVSTANLLGRNNSVNMGLLGGIRRREFEPVLAATVISFEMVYIHQLEEGNFLIHRYLIHHFLAKMKFAPQGIIFPVFLAILDRINDCRKVIRYRFWIL